MTWNLVPDSAVFMKNKAQSLVENEDFEILDH